MFCYKHGRDVVVRDTVFHDIEQMKDKMRKSDRDEVWASHHHTPEEALSMGFRYSRICLTLLHKGKPVAMFGAAAIPDVEGLGSIWLLGTDELSRCQTAFLKLSKLFVGVLLNDYQTLYNYIDVRNTTTKRWLEWCGANFKDVQTYGIEGRPFQYFEFRRDDHV